VVHRWLSDGDSIGEGLLPEHSYPVAGEYEITFEAIDVDGDTGRDTCLVRVTRLTAELETWGRIKTLYEN
jgi:hypothetical protein